MKGGTMNEQCLDLLGYCGAFCRSCLFYNKSISKESNILEYLIRCVNLDKWYKPSNFQWEEAKKFLKEMKEGRFNCKSCKVEPSWKECPIRPCVERRKLDGCWECKSFEECGTLKKIWKNHPEYLEEFINTVKEGGIEKWVKVVVERYENGKDFLGRRVYKR